MRTMKEHVVLAVKVLTLCAAAIGLIACGESKGNGAAGKADGGNSSDATFAGADAYVGDGGSNATEGGRGGGDSGGGGAGLTAGMLGTDGGCLGLGGACTGAGQCCSGDCANNVCSYPSCTSDNMACATSGSCCSQNCVSGMCAALNSTCKTLGNGCASNSDCCSGRCTSGTCQPSSFCAQPGDACSASANCCTGVCSTGDAGQSVGTCAATSPGGPANCGLTDGQLCGGTGTSGATSYDGGLPLCGGPCCSRSCAPWGPTGVLICQPASGCHVVGDLCTQDTDCCGANGLPGGSGKPVTCVITSGTVGVCRLPMGCKPDGDVCKLQTMSCNSSCDCCSGNCETQDTCKQDNVGVPRCAGPCVDAGGPCASSANCCGGAPCVRNPTAGAMPPYVCAGTQCIPACGQCTNTADCCPGTSCVSPAGSTFGTCSPCASGGPDGGTGGGPPDSGGPPNGDGGGAPNDSGGPPPGGDGGGTCSQFGQICVTAADCCNGLPCINFRCEPPVF